MSEPWFFEVLPCHPPPYPGECLSGYLSRLAEVNGFEVFWDLISELFPIFYHHDQVGLLRWEYPVHDWGRIPPRTQLSVAKLRRLTVMPWIEKFRSPPKVTLPRVMGPGRFLQSAVQRHLQVCPLCLQAQPYVRLMWRLASVQVCIDHGCLLQKACHRCGTPFEVVGRLHPHLRCSICDTDLRTLPVVPVLPDLLQRQQHRQAALGFLLDPDVSLVKEPGCDLAQAIGLKFRYLRSQMGRSLVAAAQSLGRKPGDICQLELGQRTTPMPLYLDYLELLSCSWPDLAVLEIPEEFLEDIQKIPFLHLRLCPEPNCPNHQPPPSMRVQMVRDLPGCRKVRFRCTACGRSFTYTYEGELSTLAPHASIHPGAASRGLKSPEEIAQLKELGAQGLDNVEIARQLGWGKRTVCRYWRALELEEQVHRAQAQRRAGEQEERHAAIRQRVEAILQSLLKQDGEITVQQIERLMGQCNGYLSEFPSVKKWVQAAIEPHNAQVKQRRHEEMSARLTHAVEEARNGQGTMSMRAILNHLGLYREKLVRSYPDLLAELQRAVLEHHAQQAASRAKMRQARINEAATHLANQGARLTCSSILEKAGLTWVSITADPDTNDLLHQWAGDFPSQD